MESTRQQKVASVLQRDLSEIFQRERKNDLGNSFITVTQVKVSPDLSIATVYLSFLLTKDKLGLLTHIRDLSKQIRADLAHRVRHQFRIVPDLRFFIDDTQEEAERINKLIDGLDLSNGKDDDDEE